VVAGSRENELGGAARSGEAGDGRDGASSVAGHGGGLMDEVDESWVRFEAVPQDAADLVQLGSRQPALRIAPSDLAAFVEVRRKRGGQ
jgi:hypothetical protein